MPDLSRSPDPGEFLPCEVSTRPGDPCVSPYIYARGAGLGRGFGAYLLLPFNLTYHTSNFHGAGGIGLCPLALAPFGIVAAWRDAFSKTLVLFAWLALTSWFLTQQESRFLIPVYAIAAIFSVLGWRYALEIAPSYSKFLCAAAVAISVAYGVSMMALSRKDDLHSVVSPAFAARQRRDRIPFYDSFQYLNHDPTVRKVLILDRSVPPYYSDKSYLKPFGQWGERPVPGIDDPAAILARLHEFGVTHVLDVHSEVSDFRVCETGPALTLVFERPDQRIYRVN